MPFELTAYQKTIFAELLDAWMHFREHALHIDDHNLRQRLLFHADKCVYWNHVSHLPAMKHALLSIHQIAYQLQAGDEVQHDIERIRLLMNELFRTLNLDWLI